MPLRAWPAQACADLPARYGLADFLVRSGIVVFPSHCSLADWVGASTFTDAASRHISPGARFDLAVGTAELLYFRLIRRARGLPRLIGWPSTHSARCGPNLDPRMPRTGGPGTGPWSQCWSAGRWWKRSRGGLG